MKKVWVIWMHDFFKGQGDAEYFDSIVAVYDSEEKAKAAVDVGEWISEQEVR